MYERMERILSQDEIDKIINTKVLVVGLGGVGGATFEALVRLGIKNIDVIDYDVFDKSNLNRQLLSNLSNIGQKKVLGAQIRAKSINNDIIINSYDMFLNKDNIDDIDISKYDYVLDCCDSVEAKLLLIKKCLDNNIKIISCMGTGNRLDPTKVVITDIWKTNNDPLAKKMRTLLRKEGIKKKVKVVCSTELPRKSKEGIGTISLVCNTAGFFMASFVINDII